MTVWSQWAQQARSTYREYPSQFWTLMVAAFIDRLGGALVFPFFTLYVTQRFQVGMTTVGVIFGLFSVSGLLGGMIGGALADRWGRKKIFIFGLVASALTTLCLGLATEIAIIMPLAVVAGLLSSVGGPAEQAMVADMLPENQRVEGFGIQRVVSNLAVTIGPAIGGLLAARSYLALFITDAVTSSITALLVYLLLSETLPKRQAGEPHESVRQTFGGYWQVLRDAVFLVFLAASLLSAIVYFQMNTTLAVYLRDVHGVPPQGFGYLLSLNALMVVLFQFWVTRRLRGRPAFLLMTAGTLLYAVGFGLYGPANAMTGFIVAMVIITLGEMVVAPVATSIVVLLAPEAMRGRYMAAYGFSWVIPTAIGPLLAGLVMDNLDPRWVWYGGFLVACCSALLYYGLHRRLEVEKAVPAASE